MIALVGPNSSTEFPLPLQTGEAAQLLDRLYESGALTELIDPADFRPSGIGVPMPVATPFPTPRLGLLHWPMFSAARYAFAIYLVDEYTMGQLRSQMAGGSTITTITVKFRDDPDDGAEVARSVGMRFLSARPLVRTTSGALTTTNDGETPVDAWFLTLVDTRYAALMDAVDDNNGSGGNFAAKTDTWANLFGMLNHDCFGSTSITITDSVDADYGTPNTSRWNIQNVGGQSAAWVYDAAVAAVGSRLRITPAGAAIQRPTSTHETAVTTAHTNAGTRHFGGGLLEDSDIEPGLPNYMQCWFPQGPTEYQSTLQTTYDQGSVGFLATWLDPNESDSAFADQWGDDWLAWQYCPLDARYSGFIDAPASAFLWAVEWYHDGVHAWTHFIRPPHRYSPLLDDSSYAPSATQSVINGDPQTVWTFPSAPGADPATTPVVQFTLTVDSGSSVPQATISLYPEGTSGAGALTFSATPTSSTIGSGPSWIKVTKTYAQFAAAAPTNDIELYSLPARGQIHSVVMEHTAAFTGGGLASYTLSVGISGQNTKFITTQSVFGAPGPAFQDTGTWGGGSKPIFLSNSAATSIRAYATAGGGNLNAATAGSVSFWLLVSIPPA